MRPLRSSRLLPVLAACALAAPAAHAVPLHLHVEGAVAPLFEPNEGTLALGIQPGSPVTLDLYYDPAAADSWFTASSNSETAYFALPSASFSLTLGVGPATFSSGWPGSGAGAQGAVSTYHTVGLSDPFQDYQIVSRLGSGPGCAPACVDVLLNLRDDLAPFTLYDGKSILQVPDLSATTEASGEILGWYDGVGQIQISFVPSSITLEVVPEPGTVLLLAAGLTALARRARARADG